jgi:cytochrome c oxidase cbb3-type subunit 3
MTEHKDELLQGDYDGIREMDNSLPRWWLYLFFVSIIIAVVYMVYYHVLRVGYLQEDEWRRQIDPTFVRTTAADQRLFGILPQYRTPLYAPGGDRTPRMLALAKPQKAAVFLTRETDTLTYVAVTDMARLADGEKTFKNICSQCHGKLGEGGVGPNLTDDYWLHGGAISDVVRSAKYGYPSKGMVPWQGTLKEAEIINVASYILTLRGTNPPNARAPQGDLVTY